MENALSMRRGEESLAMRGAESCVTRGRGLGMLVAMFDVQTAQHLRAAPPPALVEISLNHREGFGAAPMGLNQTGEVLGDRSIRFMHAAIKSANPHAPHSRGEFC